MKFPMSFGTTTLSFEHPSYRAAIPIILKEPGCNSLFCLVMNKLSTELNSIPNVLYQLIKHFEQLPQETNNQIIQRIYYDKLKEKIDIYPNNIPYEDSEKFIEPFSELLIQYFDKIDLDNKKILLQLLNNDELIKTILPLIAENYLNRPLEIKEKFKELILNPKNFEGTLWAISDNYEKLPNDIHKRLFDILSDKELMKTNNNASKASSIIAECFENIPSKDDIKILKLLSNYPNAGPEINWILFDYVEFIPEKDKDEICELLIQNAESFDFLTQLLASYYIVLPEFIRDEKLREILDNDRFDDFVIYLKKNYTPGIPDEVKDIILNISQEIKNQKRKNYLA